MAKIGVSCRNRRIGGYGMRYESDDLIARSREIAAQSRELRQKAREAVAKCAATLELMKATTAALKPDAGKKTERDRGPTDRRGA